MHHHVTVGGHPLCSCTEVVDAHIVETIREDKLTPAPRCGFEDRWEALRCAVRVSKMLKAAGTPMRVRVVDGVCPIKAQEDAYDAARAC